MCMIPVRGEPCVSCKARRKECTFLIPPTARKRKRKDEEASSDRARAASSSDGGRGSAALPITPAMSSYPGGSLRDIPQWSTETNVGTPSLSYVSLRFSNQADGRLGIT